MIQRAHDRAGLASTALYSDCERYRYLLSRVWSPDQPTLLFVLLNPSTATEAQNDPTVERCQRRAEALGYGGFQVANLFAFRATDPGVMRAAADPIGPDNDATLREAAKNADQILCGWGNHGAHLGRGATIAALLRATGKPLRHLGLTQTGHPAHPLYIAYARPPIIWE